MKPKKLPEENPPHPNHSHAWKGTWNRPMLVDEDSLDALTVARMTDHNVRGIDKEEVVENLHSEGELLPED